MNDCLDSSGLFIFILITRSKVSIYIYISSTVYFYESCFQNRSHHPVNEIWLADNINVPNIVTKDLAQKDKSGWQAVKKSLLLNMGFTIKSFK